MQTMVKVLLVCMGNICRSPMAQTVATQLTQRSGSEHRFTFESAGTHAGKRKAPADSRAIAALQRRGYTPGKMRSRQVEPVDFSRFDLVLAMDQNNLTELQRICPPEQAHKLQLFLHAAHTDTNEVPDPYYGNTAGFERVLDLCELGIKGLLSRASP
jgi:protein-tyrosine phosphatase